MVRQAHHERLADLIPLPRIQYGVVEGYERECSLQPGMNKKGV